MFPAGAFGVGVTVAALPSVVPDGQLLPPEVVERPSRLGELLPVDRMTAEQKAANLELVAEVEAQLAAFKAELVVGLAADRPASDDRRSGQAGAASGEWAAQLLDDVGVGVLPGRAGADPQLLARRGHPAVGTVQHAACGACRAPGQRSPTASWTGRGRGRSPRSWGGRPRLTPEVLAAVEAAVLPRAAGLSVTRLRALARAELIKADAAAADARRRLAEREADVTVRALGDGMSELRSVMPTPAAAAVRAAADARARELKAAGDERPLGMLQGGGAARPGDPPLGGVAGGQRARRRRRRAGHARVGGRRRAGHGVDPVAVDGQPVTAAQARELLERLDALCPGGLQAPTGGTSTSASPTPTAACSPTATRRELERIVRRGCADHPRATAAARCSACPAGRPVRAPPRRSGGSRRPATAPAGSPAVTTGPAGRPGPRRPVRLRRRDGLRQPVLPVPSASPAEDPRRGLALRHDARRGPVRDHAERRHPHQSATGLAVRHPRPAAHVLGTTTGAGRRRTRPPF